MSSSPHATQGRGAGALAEIRERSGRTDDGIAVMALDLASFASIRTFAADFLGRYDRLDVLLNNAGLVLQQRSETAEGFETTFGVNHLGHFLLTDLLLDRVRATSPARIINVSSARAQAGPPRPRLRRPAVDAALPRLRRVLEVEARQHLLHARAGPPARRFRRDRQRAPSRFRRQPLRSRRRHRTPGRRRDARDAAVRDQRRAGRADVHLPRLLRRPGRDLRRVLVQVRARRPRRRPRRTTTRRRRLWSASEALVAGVGA